MATPKPMGMKKQDYVEMQDLIAEKDFKFQVNHRIQSLEFAIDDLSKSLEKSIADQGSVKLSCSTQIQDVVNLTTSSLKEFRHQIGDIYTEFAARERWFKQMKDTVDKKIDSSSACEKISRSDEAIQQVRLENELMLKEFTNLIERLKADFTEKLKEQKQEILSIPSQIPSLKKDIEKQIELIELNGQNSLLRSSNNEKQIMLVERKIDNLYQLIKKIEISLQEGK